MPGRRRYVIITPPTTGRRAGWAYIHRQAGRHRFGSPDAAQPVQTPGSDRENRARRRAFWDRGRSFLHRGRHRRPVRSAIAALRYSGVTTVLAALFSSAWFAASGAAAAAQMIQP